MAMIVQTFIESAVSPKEDEIANDEIVARLADKKIGHKRFLKTRVRIVLPVTIIKTVKGKNASDPAIMI